MAVVEVTISGILYDKLNRTQQHVVLIGDASLTGLGIGGGPMPPGSGGGGSPGYPAHPWVPPFGGDPGYGAPPNWGTWGGAGQPGPFPPQGARPEHPIYYPPNVPPVLTPPTPPNPGDPVTPVPPPAGSQGWPVAAIVPPPYIVVNYPGVGPVTVPAPLTAQPKPA